MKMRLCALFCAVAAAAFGARVLNVVPLCGNASRRPSARSLAVANMSDMSFAAVLARDSVQMCSTFGIAPAPLYFISAKGFANFAIGVLALVGVVHTVKLCFPCCASQAEWRSAYTNEVIPAAHAIDEKNQFLYESMAQSDNDVDDRGSDNDVDDRGSAATTGAAQRLRRLYASMAQSSDVKMYLMPGHRVMCEGKFGIVDVAASRRGRDLREPIVSITFEDGSRADLAISATEGESRSLKNLLFTETLHSSFLSPFRVRALTVAFQTLGILSSWYGCSRLQQAAPVNSWAEWDTFCLLLSQHSLVMTLSVAAAQTITIAANASTPSEEKIGWIMVGAITIVALWAVLALLTTGLYGVVVLVLPAVPLGCLFLYLAALCLTCVDIPGLAVPESRGNKPTRVFNGKTPNEVRSEYMGKTRMGKAWFLMTFYLPAVARGCDTQLFIYVSYVLLMTPALPLWWLVLGGLGRAWPVALGFIIEVSLPLIGLVVFATLSIGRGIQSNFRRSGILMIFSFVIAQLFMILTALIVPASILAQQSGVSIGEAVPLAYEARTGSSYLRCLLLPLKEQLDNATAFLGNQTAIENFTSSASHEIDLSISQLVSMLG